MSTYDPTELQYDSDGGLIKVIDALSQETIFTLLSDGQVETITDRRGNITSLTYLSDGNLETTTTPSGPNGAPARTVTLAYDAYDNLTSVTDPLSNQVTWEFDGEDRPTLVTDARGKYVVFSYLNGLLDSMEAPANAGSGANRRTTVYSYDGSDRLVQVDAQVSLSGYQTRVGYGYDGFSNLRQLARLQNATVKTTDYSFDQLARLINTNDFAGQNTSVAYAPYCVGNLVTTARGVKQISSFDTLCRLTQRETQDERHVFEYDELDRLVAVTVASRYAWNDTNPTAHVGGVYQEAAYAHTTRYLYDSLDRVTEVQLPNGDLLSYGYDEEGNVTQLDSLVNGVGRTTLYSYYNDGRLYQVTYQRPGQADQVFTYVYDAAGRLDSITYPSSYALAGMAGLGLAVAGWPASLLWLWPTAACLILTVAYAGGGPAWLRKSGGTFPNSSYWLLAPYRWLALATFRHFARPLPHSVELCPGIHLGRRWTPDWPGPPLASVLDLTAEYPEYPGWMKLCYLNIPVLDLTCPSVEQLRQAVQFIEEASPRGPVLVHCSLGLGRSLTVGAAYLLASGQAGSVTQALDRVRAVQPRAALLPQVEAVLEQFRVQLSCHAVACAGGSPWPDCPAPPG